jgi:hypothetical protein
LANIPSIIVEFPVLDALCNELNRRSTGLWFYLIMRSKDMPMKCRDVIKDFGISKSVFYACIKDLERYNLCFVKYGKVHFYRHQIVLRHKKDNFKGMSMDQFSGFGDYGETNRRAINVRDYGKKTTT